MLRACFISIVVCLVGCNNQIEKKKIYLFPEKYQGVAVIIFGQSEGENPLYENDTEVYNIGDSGILKVKEEASTGWVKESFFYVDSSGGRTEIPYYTAMDIKDKVADRAKIICYNSERGLTTDAVIKKEKRFQVMLITSIGNLDSIANKRSSVVQAALK